MDSVTSPVLEALAGLEAAVTRAQKALAESLWQLAEADVVDVLVRLHRLDARSSAMFLGVVREVDTRGIPATVGAASLRSYLAARLRMSPARAGEQAKLAETFAGRYADTGNALAAGAVSHEQAAAIRKVLDGLPEKANFAQREWAQNFLLDAAGTFDARELRGLGKKIDEMIDPDGTLDRDDAARTKRALEFRDNDDGTGTLRWTDTDENIAYAKAAIEALAKPTPGQNGERDQRPAPVRRADGMADLIRRALDGGEAFGRSHGVRPHLTVTFSEDALRGQPGAFGQTATGERLATHVLRRLLCDCDLTWIHIDDHGVPLHMGSTVRTATPAQWIALTVRDGGCCFPNCTRPPIYCEAHHFPAVDQGRADRPRQNGPLLQPPPPLPARQRLDRTPRPRRPRRTHPTALDRPARSTPPELALEKPARPRHPRTRTRTVTDAASGDAHRDPQWTAHPN